MTILQGKTVVLGITGSIAAFKAAELASKLTQAGVAVDVIMTDAAQKFISPLTIRSLTHRPVAVGMWETPADFQIEHISLAESADLLLIAPATANTIAKIAGGRADDLLSCTALATKAPIVIAPAMNDNMYANPLTRENIARLKSHNVTFVEPAFGRLASGKLGQGRLAELDQIMGTVSAVLGRLGDLAGRKIVVTAGGTRESIDPVRYIGNRSSGKMGYALAEAARDRGANVSLISSADRPDPAGMEVTHVETAAQMKAAVTEAVEAADALIMAAAVADYQAREVADQKIKKSADLLGIELKRTPDILRDLRGQFIRVGFAAESQDLVGNATHKLVDKELDLIVANDITEPGSGFGTDTNRVTLIGKDGKVEDLPLLTKREVADRILDAVIRIGSLQGRKIESRLPSLYMAFVKGLRDKDKTPG
ncbi:MAG: bifunctional phosphopantothenoylcysteine decarboxylase/phosphopantothenate--cysteine ligase CoaBC [Methanoregulaceae archaeon]|nr:bifunctional phosphopantothenoylcysteine decarboxylase/phosphopantothenate--cysteine ligase CoaBC [Methanoregulaceae archaeon]